MSMTVAMSHAQKMTTPSNVITDSAHAHNLDQPVPLPAIVKVQVITADLDGIVLTRLVDVDSDLVCL